MTDEGSDDGRPGVAGGDGDTATGVDTGGWLRRRRWQILGAVVALAALVGGVALLVSDDAGDAPEDDDREVADRPTPTPPPAIEGDVDAEGQELLDLLEQGHQLTYHATYLVSGDPDVVGDELRLEVWRDDGSVRQDLHQVTESATVEAASFLLSDDEIISCQRIDEAEWSCARQASGDEFSVGGMFGNIARELEGADVVADDEEIAGRAARCFTLTGATGEVSQCMSEDGIPLRRSGDGVELVLSDFSDEVPDGIFTPPAEPVAGE